MIAFTIKCLIVAAIILFFLSTCTLQFRIGLEAVTPVVR